MSQPHCHTCGGQDQDLYVHGRCHPGAPTWVIVESRGTLRIVCAQCDRLIVRFKVTAIVASEPVIDVNPSDRRGQ